MKKIILFLLLFAGFQSGYLMAQSKLQSVKTLLKETFTSSVNLCTVKSIYEFKSLDIIDGQETGNNVKISGRFQYKCGNEYTKTYTCNFRAELKKILDDWAVTKIYRDSSQNENYWEIFPKDTSD